MCAPTVNLGYNLGCLWTLLALLDVEAHSFPIVRRLLLAGAGCGGCWYGRGSLWGQLPRYVSMMVGSEVRSLVMSLPLYMYVGVLGIPARNAASFVPLMNCSVAWVS
jgi:hypothetical protein